MELRCVDNTNATTTRRAPDENDEDLGGSLPDDVVLIVDGVLAFIDNNPDVVDKTMSAAGK